MPPGDRVRPTTDRVREALFSTITAWAGRAADPVERSLSGMAFCDLYAGSGAVGLEAASRGATRVLLIERDPRTAQLCRRNAEALGLAVDVVISSVEQILKKPPALLIRRTSWTPLPSAPRSNSSSSTAGSTEAP